MLVILANTRSHAQHWLAEQGARGAKAKLVYTTGHVLDAVRGTRGSTVIVLADLTRLGLYTRQEWEEYITPSLVSSQHFILYPEGKPDLLPLEHKN